MKGTLKYISLFLVFSLATVVSKAITTHADEKPEGEETIQTSTGILDGKTFTVRRGLKGHDATADDEIRFHDGKFFSVLCAKYGFDKTNYTARVEGDIIYYEVETHSPNYGKIQWSGKIQGEEIDSTYVWTQKGWFRTKVREYWHKGLIKR